MLCPLEASPHSLRYIHWMTVDRLGPRGYRCIFCVLPFTILYLTVRVLPFTTLFCTFWSYRTVRFPGDPPSRASLVGQPLLNLLTTVADWMTRLLLTIILQEFSCWLLLLTTVLLLETRLGYNRLLITISVFCLLPWHRRHFQFVEQHSTTRMFLSLPAFLLALMEGDWLLRRTHSDMMLCSERLTPSLDARVPKKQYSTHARNGTTTISFFFHHSTIILLILVIH
jgi:hypothetical protein